MSAAPVRILTTGSVALALALAAPTAALAGPSDEDRRQGGSSEQERRDDRSRSERGTSSSSGSSSSAGSQQRSSEGKSAQESDKGKGERGKSGRSSKSKSESGSRDKSGDGRAAGGDPRGNNGTVKIDGAPFDDGRGNEPHVGCVFEVDFYGFDAGDTATITFTGQAPTGGGLLHSESRTISTDAAGGGQDRDATLRYSVSDQLSELLSIAPHPQQGWHVKLAVDVDSAPGGAKQKVFWISCPPAAGSGAADSDTGATGSTTDLTTGQSSDQATTVAGGTAPTLGAGTAEVLSGTTVSAVQQQEQTLAAQGSRRPAQTTLGSATATLAAGETTAATPGSRLPSTLPFTGTEGLLGLLALGLSAVGVGAVAHRLGRKAAAGDVA